MSIQNAVIKSASLTKADHGLLSGWIMLEYKSGGQGFGGHALYLPKDFSHHDSQSNFAGHWIFRVLEIAGVDRWEDLKGKTIRVKSDVAGLGGKIEAIGHIVNDDWFSPSDDFKLMENKNLTK